jgi:hypothetical protein
LDGHEYSVPSLRILFNHVEAIASRQGTTPELFVSAVKERMIGEILIGEDDDVNVLESQEVFHHSSYLYESCSTVVFGYFNEDDKAIIMASDMYLKSTNELGIFWTHEGLEEACITAYTVEEKYSRRHVKAMCKNAGVVYGHFT